MMDLDNVYITSDLHFYHNNIIKYCNRPFYSVEEMNEAIIEQVEEIPDGALIINNGDLCLSKNIDIIKPFVDRMKLNHRLWIILGNHDHLDFNKYYELGFERVYDKPIVIDNYVFSHEPVFLKRNSGMKNIHGHTHDKNITEDYFEGNRVDVNDYINVCWDNIGIAKLKDILNHVF